MAATKIATLDQVLASRVKIYFKHRVNFHKPDIVEFAKMQSWCDRNCKGRWNSNSHYAYYFQFEDEYDATMFMLKYGGK